MPEMQINDLPEPTIIPKGEYVFEVVDVEEQTHLETGEDVWILNCIVIGGDHDGRKVRDRILWRDTMAWKIAQLATGLGKEVKEGDSVRLEINDVVGKSMKGRVSHNKGRGENADKVYANVSWIAPASEADGKPVDTENVPF